jgi:hypothetical protein
MAIHGVLLVAGVFLCLSGWTMLPHPLAKIAGDVCAIVVIAESIRSLWSIRRWKKCQALIRYFDPRIPA